MYYYGARYYDKSLGRWLVADPKSSPSDLRLNQPQSLNPYVYCWNNPLRRIDKDGKVVLSALSVALTGSEIAIGIDYLVQWKASKKTFKEFYTSGEYSLGRAFGIGLFGAAGSFTGASIATSALPLGGKVALTSLYTAGSKSLQTKMVEGQKPTAKKVIPAGVSGGVSGLIGPSLPSGKGIGVVLSHTDVVEQVGKMLINNLEEEITRTPPSTEAILEQPNKVREEILLRRPDLKEER